MSTPKFTVFERENSAVEGAHKAEILGESGIHKVVNRVSQHRKDQKSKRHKEINSARKDKRLHFTPTESAATTGEKAAQAAAAKTAGEGGTGQEIHPEPLLQKKRYKEAYAAARNGKTAAGAAAKATQTAGSKAKATIQTFFRKNKGIFIGAGAIALFVLSFGAILSSCTAMMQGTQNTFISSTYPSQVRTSMPQKMRTWRWRKNSTTRSTTWNRPIRVTMSTTIRLTKSRTTVSTDFLSDGRV